MSEEVGDSFRDWGEFAVSFFKKGKIGGPDLGMGRSPFTGGAVALRAAGAKLVVFSDRSLALLLYCTALTLRRLQPGALSFDVRNYAFVEVAFADHCIASRD